MKVSYKKIKTNIDWGYPWYDSFSKEELDNYQVFCVLWNAKLRKDLDRQHD